MCFNVPLKLTMQFQEQHVNKSTINKDAQTPQI